MSEDVAYKGKLKPAGVTLSAYMKEVEIGDWYDRENPEDLADAFADMYYGQAVLIGEMVYEVDRADLEDGEIFESTTNDDGSIDFIVRYYNGGCSFDEAIEQALKS